MKVKVSIASNFSISLGKNYSGCNLDIGFPTSGSMYSFSGPLCSLLGMRILSNVRTFFLNFIFYFFYLFFCLLLFLWAAPAAYGGSQARGLIGAVAASLRQGHSNAGSEPSLQPTSQLAATPDR